MILIMIRLVLPSKLSVQSWRQIESWLMGAPVVSEFQNRIASGKYECGYKPVLEWGTWSWYLCPLELWFWAQADLQRGLHWQDHSWFCIYIYIYIRCSNWCWVTRAEAPEVGLKSWRMQQAESFPTCVFNKLVIIWCLFHSHVTTVAHKRTCHSAKSAGGRLHLNMRTPLT